MTTTPQRSITLRRILRTVHLWIGVALGIPLALIGATGSILTYEHEIIALLDGDSQPKLATGKPQHVSTIVEVARAQAPADAQPMFFSIPGNDEPAILRFAQPGRAAAGPGASTTVRIDPVSLTLFDALERSAVQQFLRQSFQLHANLLSGREGRFWVGWFGVAMCVLGVSGIVMWWPRPSRWKKAFGVSKGAQGIRFNRELHGAVGIWGLAVFIVISFSGVYIVFPQTTGEIVRTIFPGRDIRGEAATIKVTPIEGVERMAPDDAVTLARSIAPHADLRMVGFPMRPDQPYRIGFELPGTTPGHGVPTITAFVDPWARTIVAKHDPREYTLGETISVWQRALHGGTGQGWLWQFLTFLSGLMPVLFAITGITMWWKRRRHKQVHKVAASQRPAASAAE